MSLPELDPKTLANPFVAGAAGALVGLKWAPGLSWSMRLFNLVCGALIAGFVAPALLEWLSLSSPSMYAGLSFVLGAVGMSLIAAVLDGIASTKLGEILSGWLSRR